MVLEHAAVSKQRAADAAQLMQILHESTRALCDGTAVDHILSLILRGVVKATGASGGAVLRRVGATCEFAFALILQEGTLLSGQALQEHPFAVQVRAVSRTDPARYFSRLAAGETLWHPTEDEPAGPIEEMQRWHSSRQQRALWDIPFTIGGHVAGYLGLAFERAESLSDGVRQTVIALAAQVGLTLEMANRAATAQHAAIAREHESAARAFAEERDRQAAQLASIANRVGRSLRQATDRLAQTTDVRAVIIDLLAEGSKIVEQQGVIECGLLLYDSASRLLHFEAMFANGVQTDLRGTPLEGPFSVDSDVLALPWRRIQQERWLWGLTEDASILATTAREYHESKGTRSVAYLPLRGGEECIGFVGFSLRAAHPPSSEQVDLLHSIGSQVALAVGVQRLATANEQALVARERQRLTELRSVELTKANVALQATIDAVTNLRSLDDFMPRVLAIVAAAFEAIGAGYFEHPDAAIYHRFWLEDGQLLAAADLPGLDPVHLPVLELLARGFSVPPDHLGVDFQRRLRPSIVHHRVAKASPAMHALCVSRGWDWELNIPLFANDRTDAAITFFRHEDKPFLETDISLAESLAKQISLARQVSRVGEREREVTIARGRAAELARANRVMSRVNDLMSSEISPDSALEHVLRELTTLVGADAAALYQYGPDAGQLRFKTGFERGRITDQLIGHPHGDHDSPGSVADFPAWPILVRDRQQLFIEIRADDSIAAGNAWHVAQGHKMLALSALVVGGEPVGLLSLAFMSDAPLSDTQREMFGALAQQMTLALQLVRLGDQARAVAISTEKEAAALVRARELERASTALQATIDAVSELASLEAFIPQALRIVVDAFGAKSAAYWEHTSDTIYLRHWLVDGRVFGPTELPGLKQDRYRLLAQLARGFTVSSDHLGVDFRNRNRPSLIDHRDATASPELHSFARSMGWDWELNVPLLVAGVADGALTLYRSAADPFSDGDFSLAEALAKQISLALKISRVAERERDIAVERQRVAELSKANAALRRSVDRVASAPHRESLIDSFLTESIHATGATGGSIMLRVKDSPDRFSPAATFENGHVLSAEELSADPHFTAIVPLSGHPTVTTETPAADGMPAFLVSTLRDAFPDAYRSHMARGQRLLWQVPLRVGGQVVGYAALGFPDELGPTDAARETVVALATQLALALQLTDLAEIAKLTAVAVERERMAANRTLELTRSNEALQSTIDVLATVNSLAEFVPAVLRLVSMAFDSPGCAYYEHIAGEPIFLRYWLWSSEVFGPEELRQQPCENDRGFLPVLARGFHLPVNYAGDQSRGGHTPVLIDHAQPCADELQIDRFYRAHGLGMELRVPLIVGGNSDGSLVIRRSPSQPFNESELALAGNLGKQLALATQSHRLAERARIDSLLRDEEQAVVRERERMSRDIHDTLAQGYAAILVHAQALKLALQSQMPPPVLSGMEMFERLAKENLGHARRTMEDLRADPFARVALAVALQECAREATTPDTFCVELEAPPEELFVPRRVEVEVRRIVKEALNNARRHARTTVAKINMSVWNRRCAIQVSDRGVGFDSRKVDGSYGIRGMRERAGRAGADLAIETSPGQGTIVTVTIDLEGSSDGKPR